MTALNLDHFDALDYVKGSKELGVLEPVAEYKARQIERAINIAVNTSRTEVNNKDLATKKDIKELELKIEQVKTDLKVELHKSKDDVVIWIFGLLIANGLIQHFFK